MRLEDWERLGITAGLIGVSCGIEGTRDLIADSGQSGPAWKLWSWHGRPRAGKNVEFGGNADGLGGPDPLEDLQRLPQEGLGPRGVAAGLSASAQAGQCVSLVPGGDDGAGQCQSLLVGREYRSILWDVERLRSIVALSLRPS